MIIISIFDSTRKRSFRQPARIGEEMRRLSFPKKFEDLREAGA
jgi:hypothetical protein